MAGQWMNLLKGASVSQVGNGCIEFAELGPFTFWVAVLRRERQRLDVDDAQAVRVGHVSQGVQDAFVNRQAASFDRPPLLIVNHVSNLVHLTTPTAYLRRGP